MARSKENPKDRENVSRIVRGILTACPEDMQLDEIIKIARALHRKGFKIVKLGRPAKGGKDAST
jgi:hypothetical protein